MSNPSDSYSLPPALKRVAFALRTAGWACFWVQIVLAVVSGLILLFALAFTVPGGNVAGRTSNPGTGGGLFLAVCGLLVLGYSVYRSFGYTRLARQLKTPNAIARPKKADTIQNVRLTLMGNLAGMFLTVMGAEAIGGTLLAKSLTQPRGLFDPTINLRDFIQPIDIFVVLANTHTILAHLIGIGVALWLLDQIYKD
ncbi:MAG: DUF3611 family protein [Actinomycetota bacterium]